MEVKVLMVDDHPPIIEGYKAILSFNRYGYDVKTVSAFNCEMAYAVISTTSIPFDLVMLDITLPPFPERNLHSGEDLVALIRKHLPNSKIIILTSHSESLLLLKILREHNPNGLLVKSDFQAEELLMAFDTIVRGENYHSSTIRNLKKKCLKPLKFGIVTIVKSYYFWHKEFKLKTFLNI
ncbi:response regulator [Flavobacterium phycosphaerae]|uniref:response regulator n=1 Tax=Flavobacterium phycosphaerae TaxID=2697515 RepID=UPI0013899567|nr:response regulator [Flavobacterium phycosphaerae]